MAVIRLAVGVSGLHGAPAVGDEGVEDSAKAGLVRIVELPLLLDLGKKSSVAGTEVGHKLALELGDLGGDHLVEIASHSCEDDAHLLLSHHRHLHYPTLTNCFCFSNSVS